VADSFSHDELEAIRLAAFRMQRLSPDPAAIEIGHALLQRCATLLAAAGFNFWHHPSGHWALCLDKRMPPVVLVVVSAEAISVRLPNEEPPRPVRAPLTFNAYAGAWEDDRDPLAPGAQRRQAALVLVQALLEALDRAMQR
jgi:hypothetical protein